MATDPSTLPDLLLASGACLAGWGLFARLVLDRFQRLEGKVEEMGRSVVRLETLIDPQPPHSPERPRNLRAA